MRLYFQYVPPVLTSASFPSSSDTNTIIQGTASTTIFIQSLTTDPSNFPVDTHIIISLIETSTSTLLDDLLPDPVSFTDQVDLADFTVGDTTGVTIGTYTYTLMATDAVTMTQVASYDLTIEIVDPCTVATIDASAQTGYSEVFNFSDSYRF